MNIVLLAIRLLLAGIFAVAGITKLADRVGTRRAVQAFGAPSRLALPLALLLPMAELLIAGLLLTVRLAWWGALAASALLLCVSAAVAVNLARGRRPDCHCFGQLVSSPIGWPTLGRNSALAVAAAVFLWFGYVDGGASVTSLLGGATGAESIALVIGTFALGLGATILWLLVQLLAQNGRLLVRLDGLEARIAAGSRLSSAGNGSPAVGVVAGLPIGTPAPEFQLSGLFGEVITLNSLRATRRPILIVFTDPNCGACSELMPDLARWQRELAATVTVAIVSRGTPDENRSTTTAHGLFHVLLQQATEVADLYQAHATPSAVLVRSDGTIASPLAQGAHAIRILVAQISNGANLPSSHSPPELAPVGASPACPHCGRFHSNGVASLSVGGRIGQPAPTFTTHDLAGDVVDLATFRGRDTVLLFWNPQCGFCRGMLPELRAWEADPSPDKPTLLIVSSGPAAAHETSDIRSRVLLQPDFGAGSAFGVTGTPAAVLIDREGRIASQVATGATGVFDLLRRERPAYADVVRG